MILFFFISLTFFTNFFVFFLLMVFFIFLGILDFSWSGCFLFFDSLNFLFLGFMSVFILGFIMLVEMNSSLVFYSLLVIMFSMYFFFSGSVILFYIFYELTMIPILFCLLGFGSQVEKISACYYLVFYTLFFGFPFLFFFSHVFSFFNFVYFDFYMSFEFVFILTLCFLVKFPLYFFHVWLPKAHVEAPTSASMVLAGVMLKLGGAGVYRLSKSLGFFGMEFFLFLSFLSMVICSFICMSQSDSKCLAAYSSICHMGFVFFSEILMVYWGKSMALIVMLAHGYTSVMMFYFIGELYHLCGSRLIYYLRGYFNLSLLGCFFFCSVMMSNFSFPSSLSFFSEYVMINFGVLVFLLGFVFLFFYYMISFYYSVYLMVCFLMGQKVFLNFVEGRFFFVVSLVLMSYNFFWFGYII
uniref:NADH-ubiquinone oxidoreductase chain 4 n=1 Tax=Thelazia callipaeda TaxID=103827 RepID=I6W7Z9_THECL|nr:NADH dehydrogenase subunit 4 [Thelazia callipaeda]AFN20667.1 NADH dehydrogenase subunit 4 [Thelazia callipaeda]